MLHGLKHREVLQRYLTGIFEIQIIPDMLRDILASITDSLIYFAFSGALVNFQCLILLQTRVQNYELLNSIKISLRKISN